MTPTKPQSRLQGRLEGALYPDWLPKETFGQRVNRLRAERRWSLNDLAQRSGTVKSQLHQIESGKSDTTLRYIARLAKAFEMTASELLAGVDLTEDER